MASTGILPTHQRYLNGAHLPSSIRRSFRPREKYLIILVFFTFGIVCFGAFFFLPEFKFVNSSSSVYTVYKHIQKAGPELLIPAPPHMDEFSDNFRANKLGIFRHDFQDQDDPHELEDRAKLKAKIAEDVEMDKKNQKVLERPEYNKPSTSSSSTKIVETQQKQLETIANVDNELIVTVPPGFSEHYPNINRGEDSDPVARERRNKILEVSDVFLTI